MAAHVSVLLPQALEWLDLRAGGTYVDATFGAGGHSTGIALRLARGRLVALDADPGARTPEPFPASPGLEFELVHANFRDLRDVLAQRGIMQIDGILYDLGVSSMQLDRPERGFSFREDAPLDMRLDPTQGRSAGELLRDSGERELADVIYEFGEERAARQIARAIVGRRREGKLPATTGELARLIAGVVHVRGKRERIHPATRTFQALRIAVNDELGALRASLDAAFGALAPGGRVVVISFHSLEDRIVKTLFRDDARVKALTRKPIVPALDEITHNPRARSARLRAAERVAA
ncbi:MAG TPA: 16S rRNA (cytosine(1402)-N(4))-methyltransferase RsmH [Candidatus Binatia bacterium]|nr:16S rRNA (cytosine(1402)-N(4))-methyltransferase RsmH [Candidatus Binatia bacterium]